MTTQQPLPRGDITKILWKQAFAEDFNIPVALGGILNSIYAQRFAFYPKTWHDTMNTGDYNPGIFSVENGCLKYNLRVVNGRLQCGNLVPLLPGYAPFKGPLYGRYAISFKALASRGVKAVWLIWPNSEVWPRDGESDFPEADLDKDISGFLHYQGATTSSDQAAYPTHVPMSGLWHKAEQIWTPGGVEYRLDDVVIGNTTVRVPNTGMHLCLQVESSTDGEKFDASTTGEVLIDWVTAYTYVP